VKVRALLLKAAFTHFQAAMHGAEMLENSNPGLARRFQLSYAFELEDFDNERLRKLLELKVKKQELDATAEAKKVAIELLSRARDRPNLGSAGEVENLISHAKGQEQKRRSTEGSKKQSADVVFLPQDFDKEFDGPKKRLSTAETFLRIW
jgi:AAA lid domain